MNKENVRKWVDALRSGEFAQTQYHLTEVAEDGSKSHCCLGVACEIALQNGVELTTRKYQTNLGLHRAPIGFADGIAYNDCSSILPEEVGNWLGGVSGHGQVFVNGKLTYLADLNDNQNLSFAEIADVIEQNWLSEDSNA